MILSTSKLYAGPGDIIPRPIEVIPVAGEFTLAPQTMIGMSETSDDARQAAGQLADLLDAPLGAKLQIQTPAMDAGQRGSIRLILKDTDPSSGSEGYHLSVHTDGVTIQAGTPAGLFYGIQSFRQLLPPGIEKRAKTDGVKWTIPCVEIKDAPRYAWRGLMLDVSRHFYDVGEVEHVLDLMALLKLNHFHWHLTDDQGWRIEIKKYPKLTEIGAWRDGIGFGLDPRRSTHYRADGKYGGFYTQDQIREVVAYAAKLHITVVPEIEMPGHATAAMAAYPELSVGKKTSGISTEAGVMHQIYDPSNEQTFAFVDEVMTEVAGLFPAPYIHIGGDEVPKDPWKGDPSCQAFMKAQGLKDESQLQSYFVKRVDKIIESKGRRLIGWDEILEGGLAPGATVMSWRGVAGGITAAQAGHDVVMSPTANAYFDYNQTHAPHQPKTIGGYLPLKTVYAFEPTPENLTAEEAKHILGAQGNIWTEYIPNMKQVELMAFPRACAMAEVAWSPADRKDFKDFLRRWDRYQKRLDILGVNYFNDTTAPAEPNGIRTP